MKQLALIIVLGILSIASAHASEVRHTIDLNLRSFHLQRCYANCTKRYNENNLGVTGTFDTGYNVGLFAGTLRNSFHKQSLYAGANPYFDRQMTENLTLRPGLMIGVVSGYRDTPTKGTFTEDSDLAPIFSPNVSAFWKRFHVNVGVVPSAGTTVLVLRAGIVIK